MDARSRSAEHDADDRTSAPLQAVPPQRGSAVTAFLFADVRGFTRFTDRHGAESAAVLVRDFVALAGTTATAHGGSITGTWGDQVLLQFSSARGAIRAALDLQDGCIRSTVAHPHAPLAVGIGLDAGEAATAGETSTGGALNVAARLCAAAPAGECLATWEILRLAGALPGVSYQRHRRMRLKGLDARTAVWRLRAAAADTSMRREFSDIVRSDSASRRRRNLALLAGAAGSALLAVSTITVLGQRTGTTLVPSASIGVFDSGSRRLLGSVPVGQSPESVLSAAGSIWVADTGADSVSRIDPRSRAVVQTISVGNAPVALAATPDRVWVVNSLAGTVSEISTRSNRVVGTLQTGHRPSAIAAGFGRLWVTNQADATVSSIDEAPPHGVRILDVGDAPDGVASGDGSVWVTNRGDGTVSSIDPTSFHVGSPIRVGTGPRGIAVTPSGVWVANSLDQTVSRIDPGSGTTTQIASGDEPNAIAANGQTVWVSNAGDATLTRINPRTMRAVERLYVGSSPRGLALRGSQLWVAGRSFPSAGHRGGTLVFARWWDNESIDPVVNYDGSAWAMLRLVYDGLVSLDRSPGAAAENLVPDLARSLPTPTDGGKTYAFVLRPGIRYSDGTPLLAGDLKRGIERAFRVPTGNPLYFTGIVGAPACLAHRPTCRLDRGIETDDARGTVTFHLQAPDPDFLAKLTVPFATAAPPSAPDQDVGTHPFAGTGPYWISGFSAHSMYMVRNTYFRRWSSAAQPDGFADMIMMLRTKDERAAVDAVNQGLADIASVSPLNAPNVQQAHPDQLVATPTDFNRFVVLDSHLPPFDKLQARQAVAYALDRATLARDTSLSATCRLVPPDFPGGSSGCPYSYDLAKARALVKSSGTSGARINLYTYVGPIWLAARRDISRMLAEIGYRVTFVGRPDGYPPLRPDPGKPANAIGFQWGADFPSESQFDGLFACSLAKRGGGDINLGGYCNPAVESLATRAMGSRTTDPGAAQRLWREAYAVVDQDAVTIPIGVDTVYTLVGNRVDNVVSSPFYPLPDFGQLWVR